MTTHTPPSRSARATFAAALGALSLVVAGCAAPIGPNTVGRGSVGYASTVRPGVVTSVREVTIQGADKNGIGTASGAAIGGLLGSQVGGRGTTQAIGAIGGALLGGIAGNAATRAVTTNRGLAYIVRFDNGESREIVQGPDIYIQPGTAVDVTFRPGGVVISPAG